MAEYRICFSIADELGGEISFKSNANVPYEDVIKSIDKNALVEKLCLDTMGYTANDIKFITPEEYEKEFGEG